GDIESCEGAARQEKPVKVAIGGGGITDCCARAIDASSFGKTYGIVKAGDRIAITTIFEPDKTSSHPARIDENATEVTSFANVLRQGVMSDAGIIKGRDHFNRA